MNELYDELALKYANGMPFTDVLDEHARRLTKRIENIERNIQPDHFSHQEDAFYAGIREAAEEIDPDVEVWLG